MTFLIAGGKNDPNLTQLAQACCTLNVPFIECRHDKGISPAFEWDLTSGGIAIDGKSCDVTSAFIRHDVFEGLNDPRPEIGTRALNWHQAVNGWLLANPSIRLFNRRHTALALSKPATLIAAASVGLKIPATIISNRQSTIQTAATAGFVTKPVAGGDYCYVINEVLGRTEFRHARTSCPAFLQPRLISPEVRIYIIRESEFAFEMRSTSLDYRVHQDATVIPMGVAPKVTGKLRSLMSTLHMDYGAADFKTDGETGELVFLELNTSPMFARFDLEVGGRLSKAIITELNDTSDTPAC